MIAELDLDAYFQRIGYSGEGTPTLETLQAIHYRHALTIAFENLNPFLRWPVPLDAQSLQQKLVRDRRGGYCFEQNLLFSHALKAIGFRVMGLAARVVNNVPEGTILPRTHMLLRIDLGATPYVADVGFGGMTLTGPLRLESGIEQPTPHEPFQLTSAGKDFLMQAKIAGNWRTLYRFTLEEQSLPDYEVTNWYVSTHPKSRFVTSLIAARPDRDRRYALFNNELATHHLEGPSERRVLTSVTELRDTLEGLLQIALPNTPELDTALERLIETARAAPNP